MPGCRCASPPNSASGAGSRIRTKAPAAGCDIRCCRACAPPSCKDMLDLLAKPDPRANVIARAEAGAIVRLHECSIDWCRVSGGGEKGWVPKTAIWGADADEVRD